MEPYLPTEKLPGKPASNSHGIMVSGSPPFDHERSAIQHSAFIQLLILCLSIPTSSAFPQTAPDSAAPGYLSLSSGWAFSFDTHSSNFRLFSSVIPPPDSASWRRLDGGISRSELDSGRALWLRLQLPDRPWNQAYLAFPQNVTTALIVSMNGKEIYRSGDSSGNASGSLHGKSWHRIALPKGWQGRMLYVYLPEPVNGSLSPESTLLASDMDLADIVSLRITETIRQDITDLTLGLIIAVSGILSLLLSTLQRKRDALAALVFGLVALEYGVRTIVDTPTISLLFNISPIALQYLSAFVTYSIPIPFTLFVWLSIGWGWKSSIRWMLLVECVFGVGAMIFDGITGTPYAAHTPFVNILSILELLVVMINIYILRSLIVKERRVLAGGYALFVVIVVLENLLGGGFRPAGLRPEPFGFVILLLSLAYVVVYRFIESDRQLVAIDKELETARRIQSSILPKENPALLGLTLCARYVPMASVAGDFYDFVPCGAGALGILVADVSGHGVPAAMIASMLKVALSAQESVSTDPAAVIGGLNHIFCGKLGREFITAAYAYLDLDKRTVVYSGAGHLPLLLYRRSQNSVVDVHAPGLFLGKMPAASYVSEHIQCGAGDRVFLYTDGVIETRNAEGGMLGEEGFREFIIAHSDAPLERFADLLLEHLAAWTGKTEAAALEDDVTFVIAEFSAAP